MRCVYDPYEVPVDPNIVLTTTDCSPEENAQRVITFVIETGFVLSEGDDRHFQLG